MYLKIEVETLKNALKKSNQEVKKLKKDLADEHEVVKDKDNQLSKLNKRCENLTLNIKNTKTELNKVKNENKKLLKRRSKKLLPTSDQIRGCIDTQLEQPPWPCHGQSIERTLKKVSEASLQLAGFEMRDGWIRAGDDSRKKLPKMDSKRDYKSLLM